MNRPDWEKYFIDIAEAVSQRATCPVAKVGAVFVNGATNAILSVGYNGAPRGTQHCDKCDDRKMGENSHVCKAVHAELNAIFNAAMNGVSLKGSHVYQTTSPCLKCAQALVQVGVKQVVWRLDNDYLTATTDLFDQACCIDYWGESWIIS